MKKEALIHFSHPLIQKEVLKIPLKLDVTGFTALSRSLEKWKTRDNVKQFSIPGEDGEVKAESWVERF